ncbi:hypothetical protein N0M98_04925 [Paenibacillus doosanensis]|uniref:Uncharacterized protein n=1 Tax=Paenibacillus konkukensis TaxID=2020716 RepID=A0ABY4RXZ1_9BACL|nr:MULTISPECIES: hypothetical protein [Paenibacillus]MCS7459476.1 hypothetical protein [Paenibacillus doosanensis]UQZ87270.1 hypothetical protein SK3146_06567 [Paenibacillus konkukensis]
MPNFFRSLLLVIIFVFCIQFSAFAESSQLVGSTDTSQVLQTKVVEMNEPVDGVIAIYKDDAEVSTQAFAVGTISCRAVEWYQDCKWNVSMVGDTINYIDLVMNYEKVDADGLIIPAGSDTFKYPLNPAKTSFGDVGTEYQPTAGNYRATIGGKLYGREGTYTLVTIKSAVVYVPET